MDDLILMQVATHRGEKKSLYTTMIWSDNLFNIHDIVLDTPKLKKLWSDLSLT